MAGLGTGSWALVTSRYEENMQGGVHMPTWGSLAQLGMGTETFPHGETGLGVSLCPSIEQERCLCIPTCRWTVLGCGPIGSEQTSVYRAEPVSFKVKKTS